MDVFPWRINHHSSFAKFARCPGFEWHPKLVPGCLLIAPGLMFAGEARLEQRFGPEVKRRVRKWSAPARIAHHPFRPVGNRVVWPTSHERTVVNHAVLDEEWIKQGRPAGS